MCVCVCCAYVRAYVMSIKSTHANLCQAAGTGGGVAAIAKTGYMYALNSSRITVPAKDDFWLNVSYQ